MKIQRIRNSQQKHENVRETQALSLQFCSFFGSFIDPLPSCDLCEHQPSSLHHRCLLHSLAPLVPPYVGRFICNLSNLLLHIKNTKTPKSKLHIERCWFERPKEVGLHLYVWLPGGSRDRERCLADARSPFSPVTQTLSPHGIASHTGSTSLFFHSASFFFPFYMFFWL